VSGPGPAAADPASPGSHPVDAGGVHLRFDTPGLSDTEVAAITVALLSASPGAAAPALHGAAAWRHAGMLEAATDRRVRTPAELRQPG
jgi:hypothetical protein